MSPPNARDLGKAQKIIDQHQAFVWEVCNEVPQYMNKLRFEIAKVLDEEKAPLLKALQRIAKFEPWNIELNPGCGSSECAISGYKSQIAREALEGANE